MAEYLLSCPPLVYHPRRQPRSLLRGSVPRPGAGPGLRLTGERSTCARSPDSLAPTAPVPSQPTRQPAAVGDVRAAARCGALWRAVAPSSPPSLPPINVPCPCPAARALPPAPSTAPPATNPFVACFLGASPHPRRWCAPLNDTASGVCLRKSQAATLRPRDQWICAAGGPLRPKPGPEWRIHGSTNWAWFIRCLQLPWLAASALTTALLAAVSVGHGWRLARGTRARRAPPSLPLDAAFFASAALLAATATRWQAGKAAATLPHLATLSWPCVAALIVDAPCDSALTPSPQTRLSAHRRAGSVARRGAAVAGGRAAARGRVL